MRLIDADALRQVLEVFTEKDTLGHTPLQLCDAMPTAPRWHRVEDELPEKEGDYLIWTMLYGGHAYTDYYTPKYGWDEYKVIAWMPLPEPPKEDE